jgi:hypothetical protein
MKTSVGSAGDQTASRADRADNSSPIGRDLQLALLEAVERGANPEAVPWGNKPAAAEWLLPYLDGGAGLNDQGTMVLDEIRATALHNSDELAELLVLRAAVEFETHDALFRVVSDTPIREGHRLVTRLAEAGLLLVSPPERATPFGLAPYLRTRGISDTGVLRLRELEARMRLGKPLRLFFSWQNDDPARTRRIRTALEAICTNLNLTFDEATRDEAGSPEIHRIVLGKIGAADLFVADVDLVVGIGEGCGRKSPNPNVMYELGYAAARLGDDRVLLLCDGAPSDLPFDIRQRRVSRFDNNLETYVRKMSELALVARRHV